MATERVITKFGTIVIDRTAKIIIGDIVWDGRCNPQEPDYPFYEIEESDDIPQHHMADTKVVDSEFRIFGKF